MTSNSLMFSHIRKPSIIHSLAAISLGLFLTIPAQAFKVMLSPGASNNTTAATDKSLWPYSAANVDGGKFGGLWENPFYTPTSDRQKIANNYTNKIAQIEDIVLNFDRVDSNGDPVIPSWIANKTLPGNYNTTAVLGQNVVFANFYNANGRSWNTVSELNDIKEAFTNSGVTNVNFGTIIRNSGGGYKTFLEPYGHFLFEIRLDTVRTSTGLQNALIETTRWGLDNGKDVFLQLLPQRGSRDFEFDMRAVMEILYNRLGAARFQSDKLWIVLASYDESTYDTLFTPETLNGANHFNTLTGVSKTMLENRAAWHAGNFSNPRSTYTVEAESASGQDKFSPYTTITESGITYIVWPGSSFSNGSHPTSPDGRAKYNFTLSTAGNVALEASVNLANDDSDSFWYKVNDSPWQLKRDESGGGQSWIGLGQFVLKAGDHTLEIARRRGNVKLDKFRFATTTGTVSATPVRPIIASAGLDQTVYDYDGNNSEEITLIGTGSSVTSGSIASYVWKKGAAQIATGETPVINLGIGTHDITLTVTSSTGATATSDTRVIVRANDGKVVVENSTDSVVDTSAFGETHTISNFRIAKGVGRKLVVTVGAKNVGDLSVKYANRPLTLAKAQFDGQSYASIWFLDNPPVGVGDIVQSGGAARGSSLGALSLQNAAPGFTFSAGAQDRRITYSTSQPNTLIVGSYSDSFENAGPSAPFAGKFVTSGGWGGSALAGWENDGSPGSRTDTYRAPTTKSVAIATVGFIAAKPKDIEAETAVGQPNFSPLIQQTETDGTINIVVPNGTGNVNPGSVTDLSGSASYPFSLTAAADVSIDVRALFATSADDSFWFRMDNGLWIKSQQTASSAYQWISIATFPGLSAGSHTFQIARLEDGVKFDKFRITPSTGDVSFLPAIPVYNTYGNGGIPGSGNPWEISDLQTTRIEAENYDVGARGETHLDNSGGNAGGAYRTDWVDIQATEDPGGGFNVSHIDNGEWLQYTVNVARTGYYTLNLRTARQPVGTGLIRVRFNGVDKTGSLIVPNTGNYQSFVDIPVTVQLNAGQQVMRVEMLSSNFNLNYIELAPQNIPAPWQHADIGAVGAEGDAIFNDGKFTVFGSGGDIHGQSDKFQYAYQQATGDCELIVRVASIESTNAGAKAGVMIRETLDTDSRHFSMFLTPAEGARYSQRTNTGGFTGATNQTGLTAPYWLRIKRAGTFFTGAYSADGVTWTPLGTQSFSMPATLYIGMAVTGKNTGVLSAAAFDNVSITAQTPPEITSIDDVSLAPNTSTGAIDFEVDDAQTAPGSLVVTAASSNTALLPNGNIQLAGSGSNRTITATPNQNQFGSSTITVSVSDGSLTTSQTFVLTVSGSNSDSWRLTHFGTTQNSGTAASTFDADGDGESNLLEYATGQNPKAGTTASTPVEVSPTDFSLTYTRSRAALAEGIVFEVEWSDSLASSGWSTVGVSDQVLSESAQTQTIKATFPKGTNGKRFARLKVTEN